MKIHWTLSLPGQTFWHEKKSGKKRKQTETLKHAKLTVNAPDFLKAEGPKKRTYLSTKLFFSRFVMNGGRDGY